jgi:maleate isomerase
VSAPAAPGSEAPFLPPLAILCDDLLTAVGADRVTVRVDLPELGLHVDRVAAEACGSGMASLAADGSIDQRGLDTVRWLDRHRMVLVQPDFAEPPFPPTALIDAYGVQAQMLAPLVADGVLVGWVSVHHGEVRRWSMEDVRTVRAYAAMALELLGLDP